MMAAVNALIKNTGGAIMLYASSRDVALEREALSKWFDEKWAAIPRQTELVKALLTDGGDTLAKAAPAEALDITIRAHQLKAKHGRDAKFWAVIGQGEEMAKVLDDYNTRSAELDRLEKRSDLSFAVMPAPVPRHSGHHQ